MLEGIRLVLPPFPSATPAPPPPPPYTVPQRRSPGEEAAAAQAGRPGCPCDFPALTAGPLPLAVVAIQPPLYLLALQG